MPNLNNREITIFIIIILHKIEKVKIIILFFYQIYFRWSIWTLRILGILIKNILSCFKIKSTTFKSFFFFFLNILFDKLLLHLVLISLSFWVNRWTISYNRLKNKLNLNEIVLYFVREEERWNKMWFKVLI